MDFGSQHPKLLGPLPGERSRRWIDRLAARECPAITARRARRAQTLGAADDDPVVWSRARGANVEDVDGNIFVDLTAGFGVAGVGHGHSAVREAVHEQADRLLHAMGDAFADPRRIELMEAVAARTGLERTILGSSGSDAVEAALKTARLATGRSAVLAFEGGYHGLSYGALAATHYKHQAFRSPFEAQLGGHIQHAQFGAEVPPLDDVGAVLVEPIQGRGGIRLPPEGWLADLIEAAHCAGAVVIFDEIYTGFGRTGAWLRAHAEGVTPDLVCVGKGMGGGLPISACVGTASVMDAWGASRGEAIHTQTFLGHPLGCAAALACIEVLESVIPTVDETGQWIRGELSQLGISTRGVGLMIGLEVEAPLRISRALMQQGYIALPAGVVGSEVLALTPPLNITREQLKGFVEAMKTIL